MGHEFFSFSWNKSLFSQSFPWSIMMASSVRIFMTLLLTVPDWFANDTRWSDCLYLSNQLLLAASAGYRLRRSEWIAGLSSGLEQISGPLLVAGSGLLLYGSYQFYKKRKMNTVLLRSTITCPECGHAQEEIMPTDACQFFYQCTACQIVLKPKTGDCCVFCSYGTVDCPPIQQGEKCCE
jgi:hypothetical protein